MEIGGLCEQGSEGDDKAEVIIGSVNVKKIVPSEPAND